MIIYTTAFLLRRYILFFIGICFGITTVTAQVSITCPGDISQNNDPGSCGAIVQFTHPEGTGSGTNITTTLVTGLASGSYFDVGTSEVIFEVSNDEGDTDQCSFFITINDNEDPVFDCPDNMEVHLEVGECSGVVNFDVPDVNDNCHVFSVYQSGGQPSGSTFSVGEHYLDFTAFDIDGNQAFCRVILTVHDVTNPEITCLDDIVVSAAASCEAVVNYTPPVGTDACSTPSTVLTSGIGSGGTFPIGTTTETYTVTDEDGNTASCSFNITVVDDTPPVINCPADQAIAMGPDECEAIINFPIPSVSDNCPNITIIQTNGLPSGSAFPAGQHIVEFTATDEAGNTAICAYTYTVTETIDPEIICPSDIVVENEEGICGAHVIFPDPVGYDNCNIYTIELTSGIPSGELFPIGTTINAYTITDPSGNSAICRFSITVNDSEAPIIECADISVPTDAGACGAMVNFLDPAVTDNCGVNTFSQTNGPASGSIFPVGSTSIEYTATDVAGNTSSCTFEVIVEDQEAPEITCPANFSFTIPNDECTTAISYPDPVVTDNCPGESWSVISGPLNGDVVSAGNYIVQFEAADAAGNTRTCELEISILETSDPVLECPGDLFFPLNLNDACEGVVTFAAPTATDDCSDVTVVQTGGPASGDTFPAGATTVEFTATDEFGNTDICSFDIVVISSLEPEVYCSNDIVIPADPGVCEAIVNYDEPTSNDDCGIATIQRIVGPASGSSFPLGETTITYEITDLEGNSGLCSFTVTVNDDENPEVTCPADIAITLPDGDCAGSVMYDLPIAIDNCGISELSITEGFESGEMFPVGTTVVSYVATDNSGNTTSCSFNVTLIENVPPEINCPADIIVDNDPGICGAVVTFTPPIGTDNCGDATTVLSAGLDSGSEFPVGTTTVTYTVTDLSGNQADCSFEVTVTDTENPVFTCPEDIILESASDQCGAAYTFTAPEANDNCTASPLITQTSGPVSGSVLPLGETIFTFTAEDDAGNIETCSYTVSVVDVTPPIFTDCPSDSTVYLTANSCTATINYGNPLASDNCNVTISQTAGPSNGADLGPGEYHYEITASDNAGNTVICVFSYTVIDTIAPVITCPASFDTCNLNPEFEFPTATDNCAIDTIIQIEGPASGSPFPEGETELSFVAYDLSGNTDTCSFSITVLKSAPQPNAGEDMVLCDESVATLTGNDPDGALITWTRLEGTGDISSPNEAQTQITGLEGGVSRFVYSLDPQTGCEVKSDTVTIIVENGVTVDAGPTLLIMYGSNTTLSASPLSEGGTFIWSPANDLNCTECENPVASPDITTIYTVNYTSLIGCPASDTVIVRVFRELPNTITPDGDGVNDVWNIPEIERFPQAHVVIYNRWGNTVYESTGYHDPWDGTHNGKELPTGSYFYIIDYKVPGEEVMNGTVNIIR